METVAKSLTSDEWTAVGAVLTAYAMGLVKGINLDDICSARDAEAILKRWTQK